MFSNVTSSATLSSTLLCELHLLSLWPPSLVFSSQTDLSWILPSCARLSTAINCDNYKAPQIFPISQNHYSLLPGVHYLESIASSILFTFFSLSESRLDLVDLKGK